MDWNERDENRKTTRNSGEFDFNDGRTGDGKDREPDVLGRIDQYEILKELGMGWFGSLRLSRGSVWKWHFAPVVPVEKYLKTLVPGCPLPEANWQM